MGCEQCLSYNETLIYRRAKGLANFVRYNEVSLYRGSYNCITRGKKIVRYTEDFVLYRSSLYRGSTRSISSHCRASNRSYAPGPHLREASTLITVFFFVVVVVVVFP